MVRRHVAEIHSRGGRFSRPGHHFYFLRYPDPIGAPGQAPGPAIGSQEKEPQHSRSTPFGFLASAMDGSDGIVDEHAQTTRGSLGDTVSQTRPTQVVHVSSNNPRSKNETSYRRRRHRL